MNEIKYEVPNELPPKSVDVNLEGQKAVVTGASNGLGASVAIELAESGADVVVNYYTDKTGAEEVANLVEKSGSKAIVIKADVSDEQAVIDMFEAGAREFGRIDICVPNSGLQLNAPFAEMTMQQWQRVLDVNLTGQFLASREAVRYFLKQGINRAISYSAGKIVYMSSVHDVIPWEGHVNYATAKGGIMLMMKSVAQELAHLRIRANSVSPGAIRTPMNMEKVTSSEVFEESLLRLMPYKRIGEPEDVGRAVAWLASDASDYINGTTLYVDGGMTLYPGFIGGG